MVTFGIEEVVEVEEIGEDSRFVNFWWTRLLGRLPEPHSHGSVPSGLDENQMPVTIEVEDTQVEDEESRGLGGCLDRGHGCVGTREDRTPTPCCNVEENNMEFRESSGQGSGGPSQSSIAASDADGGEGGRARATGMPTRGHRRRSWSTSGYQKGKPVRAPRSAATCLHRAPGTAWLREASMSCPATRRTWARQRSSHRSAIGPNAEVAEMLRG